MAWHATTVNCDRLLVATSTTLRRQEVLLFADLHLDAPFARARPATAAGCAARIVETLTRILPWPMRSAWTRSCAPATCSSTIA